MSDGSTLYPLHGVVSVVQTPFDDDGRIDFSSLAATVEDRLAAGVAGLLAPAVASESAALDAAASATELAESVALAALARDLGCAGVVAEAPAPLLRDGDALARHFEAIASAGPPMLMVQDLDWTGPGIPVEILAGLFDRIPAFRCVKIETVPAGPKYSAVLAATGGRLNVGGGWASMQLIEALDRGVHAFVPSAHHWVYVEIVRRYRAGRRDEAKKLFERLLPILAFCTQHIDVSIQFQKLLAVRQGIFRTAHVRAPAVRLDEHHRRVADELLDLAVALHREVGRDGS